MQKKSGNLSQFYCIGYLSLNVDMYGYLTPKCNGQWSTPKTELQSSIEYNNPCYYEVLRHV